MQVLRALITATALASALAGCSMQQLYGTGQAWQRSECNKIIDTQERNRCAASTQTSYEDYRRQSDAAKTAK
ncbi:MAG: hypothetical protein Q8K38_03360 [Burkholderiaceae bacterium]|nr:hypothetical protein [Burkholderiaceae bacterium]